MLLVVYWQQQLWMYLLSVFTIYRPQKYYKTIETGSGRHIDHRHINGVAGGSSSEQLWMYLNLKVAVITIITIAIMYTCTYYYNSYYYNSYYYNTATLDVPKPIGSIVLLVVLLLLHVILIMSCYITMIAQHFISYHSIVRSVFINSNRKN